MAAGDLTDLATVKGWLSMTGTSDDGLLASLITACSAAIQSYLNRNFAQQAYTELRNGTGTSRMVVANYPLVSVQSVLVNGQAVQQSSDGFTQYGWTFDDRGLTMIGDVWARGTRNVQIIYTAGYASVPLDIAQTCAEWVAFCYRERDRIGHASKSVQGETTAYITAAMPQRVQLMLSQYKKVVPL
jgi:hypothetical protein